MEILDNFASLLFFFFILWCQTFSVSSRVLDPKPDPGWFSRSRASMARLTQKIKNTKKGNLENLFNGILNIFHRSGPRALDPYPDPDTGSTSLARRWKIELKDK